MNRACTVNCATFKDNRMTKDQHAVLHYQGKMKCSSGPSKSSTPKVLSRFLATATRPAMQVRDR